MDNEKKYPIEKSHELTEAEKDQIRFRVAHGNANIYELAREFNCSPSQIAGIKAAMTRNGS